MSIRIFESGGPSPKGPSGEAPDESSPIEAHIVWAIRHVFDPEIPVNVYDLGLIYRIDFDETTGNVAIDMTLTAANCPEAQSIPQRVKEAAESVEQVDQADVQLVWEPAWDREMMSDEVKLQLGLL